MDSKEAFKFWENGVLRKGCKVKMSSLVGFEDFTEIDYAFVKRARPFELEDDYVAVVIKGSVFDSYWVDEMVTEDGLKLTF